MSIQDLRARMDALKEQESKQAIINEQTKKGQAGEQLLEFGKKAIPAGLAAYLTAGILPAILPGGTSVAAAGPATAAGAGATADIGLGAAIAKNLAPSATNFMAAIGGASKGANAASPQEAVLAGITSGVSPTKEKYAQMLLGDKLKGLGLPKIPATATVDKEGKVSSTYKTTQPTKEMTDYQKNWLALQEKRLQKEGRGGSGKSDSVANYSPDEIAKAAEAVGSYARWRKLRDTEKLSYLKNVRNHPAPVVAPTATPENNDPASLGL